MENTTKDKLSFDVHASLRSYELKMSIIEKMTLGIIGSNLRGLVISGSPGIGKSYTVTKVLNKERDPRHLDVVINKGHVTPYQLYKMIQEHCNEDSILVFDDCDAVLYNTQALNLLKAATEFAAHRYVTWNSTLNGDTGLDDKFEFKGKIIILTNCVLNDNPHFNAFVDRIQYYDCKVTFEEKLAKIMTLAKSIGDQINPSYEYTDVLRYIINNKSRIDHDRFSLRNFIKLAELKVLFGKDWENYVNVMESVVDFISEN